MINNILKIGAMDNGSCGSERWRVGIMRMKIRNKHIFKTVKAIGAASLALGFLGCVSQKPELTEIETPNSGEFSTQGKLTKTIQTPNGPVKIYDPVKNLLAIERLKQSAAAFRANNSDDDYFLIRKVLRAELERQDIDILQANCQVFKRTNNCVVHKRKNEIISTCFALNYDRMRKAMVMKINEKYYFQTQSSKTYGHYFSSEPLQLAELFEFQCMKWDYQN
jgi:hypothetical protein